MKNLQGKVAVVTGAASGIGLALEPGDVLSMRTPGGGGNGDPLERPVEAVAADVAAGLVTPAHARAAYGVVMADGAVDPAATRALRAERRAASGPPAAFDFGAARDAHERRWPPPLRMRSSRCS